MWRLGLLGLSFVVLAPAAQAQYWGSPYDRGYSYYRPAPQYRSFNWWDDDDEDVYRPRARGPAQQSGGERPQIARQTPPTIAFPSSYPVGSIVIDTRGRRLFLVQSPSSALLYQISVGREGFTWTGTEKISRKAEWPDWYPPEEMRERDPRLPEKMTGGIRNPLGAMALYLGNSLYRIHGTNDAKSIGRAASSGCFRMLNAHILDLASRVDVGTPVTVVHRLPPELDRVVAQQAGDPYRQRASRSIERF
jgi:lipoprotein-anchoring transpeptidase ErfK/SrfK